MITKAYISQLRIGSTLFVLSTFLVLSGATLWTGRNMWDWPVSESAGYLIWERGLILAAIVAVVLGLALLEDGLMTKGDLFAARLGYVTYLIAGVLGIVAESYLISGREPLYALIVIYVVMAFLGQTALGVSLLITKLLPAWIGWSTIVWNLAFLVLLFAISPADIYYPVAHHVMPLVIGIAYLARKEAATAHKRQPTHPAIAN
jgi:hypothetical protein